MRIRLTTRFIRYAVVGVLGISIGGTGGIFASALIPDPEGVIHACYQRSDGDIHIVADSSMCKKNEVAISWNQKGPIGATGPTGQTGPAGATGAGGAAGMRTGAVGGGANERST